MIVDKKLKQIATKAFKPVNGCVRLTSNESLSHKCLSTSRGIKYHITSSETLENSAKLP